MAQPNPYAGQSAFGQANGANFGGAFGQSGYGQTPEGANQGVTPPPGQFGGPQQFGQPNIYMQQQQQQQARQQQQPHQQPQFQPPPFQQPQFQQPPQQSHQQQPIQQNQPLQQQGLQQHQQQQSFGGAPNAYRQAQAQVASNPYMAGKDGPTSMPGSHGMGGASAGGAYAGGRGPIARPTSPNFLPLRELSPYNNKWAIKARVTVKGDKRKFTNQRGEGQLFSVDLIDESGGETRATFFGKAVDSWYDYLQHGKVYSFSKGQVKPANRKFYSKAEYEITFDENAAIVLLDDSDGVSIPALKYDFIPLKAVANAEVNATVDVKGILVEVRDAITISLRSGGEKRKRSLYLADDSNTKCEFTIWGDKADLEYEQGGAVFIKNARVGEFGGKNLSYQSSCHMELSPDDRRATDLKKWYETTGCNASFTMLSSGGGGTSSRTTFEAMMEEDLTIGIPVDGKEPKATHWHNICPAYIAYIVKDFPPFYLACPAEVDSTDKEGRPNKRVCNKKADKIPDREDYTCANMHNFPHPKARYIARVKVQDLTNQIEATAFDEVGQKLFQADANEVWQLWEKKDQDPEAARQLEEIFSRAFFTRWNMKIKSVKEKYQEEDRIKRQIQDITPINIAEEYQRHIEFLEKN